MGRCRRLVRENPATTVTATVTAVIGLSAIQLPAMTTALQQDPALVAAGQVWRLVSPIFVQGYGIGQYLFNLLGIVFIGAAVERRFGWERWVALYLLAGIIAIVVTSILFPNEIDSGASSAVAGLIGALAIDTLRARMLAGWAAYLYSGFFIIYLTVLALNGPVVAALVGSTILPSLIISRKFVPCAVLHRIHSLVIIMGTLLLVALRDAHGLGALVGLLFAIAIPRKVNQ